jgi:predicted ABC-type ATPase
MNCAKRQWRPPVAVTDDLGFRPSIYVLAGTNGAGKSSVAGAALRKGGADYFNPDEVTRDHLAAHPGITLETANSWAWTEGTRLLERAIVERRDFTFETTLGGNTITALLERAVESGLHVHVWYVGLDSPELHLARVRARVAKGGHDIPEAKIRERYDRSRTNLVRLLPKLNSLHLYDNSEEGDPAREGPKPKLILHVGDGRILESCPLDEVPHWAKLIVEAAVQLSSSPKLIREHK